MTEYEFTARFIMPLFDLLIMNDKGCTLKIGEQNLEMVKKYINDGLNEDDTRLPGPNIDGLVVSKDSNIPFCLIEASGPPHSASTNYTHFKGDRTKIAKNLKYLLKGIINMKGTPCITSIKALKLFGIHIYDDKFYVYYMSMSV